jgi:hypothetical protein
MKLAEVPEGAEFLDVDGVALVVLPTAQCIEFLVGSGTDVESRPYADGAQAGMEGDVLSREEFARWVTAGGAR